jgi:hypothetical protein
MDMARVILDVFGQVAFSAWPYRFFDLQGKGWVPVIWLRLAEPYLQVPTRYGL